MNLVEIRGEKFERDEIVNALEKSLTDTEVIIVVRKGTDAHNIVAALLKLIEPLIRGKRII